jgi:hypothetical protein
VAVLAAETLDVTLDVAFVLFGPIFCLCRRLNQIIGYDSHIK